MIYTCHQCLFTFRRTGTVENCPDCGKPTVREATDKEKEEFEKYRLEQEQSKEEDNQA